MKKEKLDAKKIVDENDKVVAPLFNSSKKTEKNKEEKQ